MAEQKLKVRLFFELMGWPEEALNTHLKKIVDHLKTIWKVTKEEYAKPEKVSEKIFTSHVEMEAEVPKITDLFMVVLNFGPSVVEVLEPVEFVLTAGELQDMMADASAKVNTMDQDVKVLAAQLKQATSIIEKLQKQPEKEKEAENKSPEEGSKFTI